jgi:peptidoglycan/LPS O-acetylase OafA/YrhL
MIILCCMAWRSFAYAYFQLGNSYAYNAFETRADSLAVGCLLAVLLQKHFIRELVDKGAAIPLLSVVLVFVMIIWLHINGSPLYSYTVGFTISSLLVAFLLTQLIALSTHGIWRFLEYPPIRYIGIISYPIYLWHGRCLELAAKIGISDSWLKALIGILISVVVASASYYFIEKPFLKLKRRFASA